MMLSLLHTNLLCLLRLNHPLSLLLNLLCISSDEALWLASIDTLAMNVVHSLLPLNLLELTNCLFLLFLSIFTWLVGYSRFQWFHQLFICGLLYRGFCDFWLNTAMLLNKRLVGTGLFVEDWVDGSHIGRRVLCWCRGWRSLGSWLLRKDLLCNRLSLSQRYRCLDLFSWSRLRVL